MSAGAIRAPLIIPLRLPTPGVPKTHIDTNTRLEIISETPNVDIYFTINGSRPVVKKTERELLNTGTYKFHSPFTLPVGLQTVRAIAFLPDTGNESNVVTKTFEIVKAESPEGEEGTAPLTNDYGFLDDLKAIESQRKKHSYNSFNRLQTRQFIRQLMERHDLGQSKKSKSLKAKAGFRTFEEDDGDQEDTAVDVSIRRDSTGVKVNTSVSSDDFVHPFDVALPKRLPAASLLDPSLQLTRLQKSTDLLHCPHCFNPRSTNPGHTFCAHCGQTLPRLPAARAQPTVMDQLGECSYCRSSVPLNFTTCLVCENRLRPNPREDLKPREYRLCGICGTANPSDLTSCLTCEARLPTGVQNLLRQSAIGNHRIGPPPPPPPPIRPLSSELTTTRPQTNGFHFVSCPHCRRENNPDARYCDWCGLETREIHTSDSPSHRDQRAWTPAPTANRNMSQVMPPWLGHPPTTDMHRPFGHPTTADHSPIQCVQCGNRVYQGAKFCSWCGFHIDPPLRQSAWSSQLISHGDVNDTGRFDEGGLNSFKPRHVPLLSNMGTQTVGLFYPSAAELRHQESQIRAQSDAQFRDRVPLLTAVSPGRGFWRKQLDHIIAHLKVYTNNNPEFRAIIGEPRLGKLIVADLHESCGQATISLTYALPHTNSENYSNQLSAGRYQIRDTHSANRHQIPDKEVKQHRVHSTYSSKSVMDASPERGWETSVRNKEDLSTPALSSKEPNFSNVYSNEEPSEAEDNTVTDEDAQSREIRSAVLLSPSRVESASSDHELGSIDSFTSQHPPNGKPRGRVKQKTSLNNNGNDTSRSRQTSTSRSVNSDQKSRKRQGKKSDQSGCHGEAGVALLRQSKLSTTDQNLIYILGKPDEGTQDDLRRLIEEGANPNCVNASGNTPLVLAVQNRKVGAIPILIEAGAKVNAAGASNGNTALHEAVLCGFDGVELVSTLLKCGANPKIKNKRKETAHALALRIKCEPLTRLFVAHMGQQQIQQLTKETNQLASGDTESEQF
ncbi:Double zinc ribbon and ankyrin repeat-containing protein 1 [Paragonimus heterotremus]|uniref:Double zinc ribbon and ankyrin repeat-containing protein 1 n=1 Tax=Paragonimus heterotremus TaxID=100268 RepID=A0A8J4TF62_9TREM|nr:Double zinc ribbon and ankyrin repeat-containing protein 1 [Paragonimus heterotremus]